MKTDILIILVIFALLFTGCTYDRLPPKTDGAASQYVLPKGEIPSNADREALDAIRTEYENYITNP